MVWKNMKPILLFVHAVSTFLKQLTMDKICAKCAHNGNIKNRWSNKKSRRSIGFLHPDYHKIRRWWPIPSKMGDGYSPWNVQEDNRNDRAKMENCEKNSRWVEAWMSDVDINVRISPTALRQLKTIKGLILVEDGDNKSIKQIIEEMVDKCHSSIDSSKVLKESLDQVEK